MTHDRIQEILRLHALWLREDSAGRRADLSGADLYGVNLSGVNLSRANLSNVNFSNADLSSATLFCADLSGAGLYGVDLSNADLSGANLSSANLSDAYLFGANFSSGVLSRAKLSRANLSRANLYHADLCHTNLSEVNLSCADLFNADLSGAKGFAPSMMLLVDWGYLSDDLCKLAMAYDASGHADLTAFDRWKETGVCPYKDVTYTRLCNFHEKRELWDPIVKAPKTYDLMVALIKEKCANSDWHSS